MDDDKTLKSFQFTGKSEHYMMWAAKFMSYAQVKTFRGVLEGTTPIPVGPNDEPILLDDEDVTHQKYMKTNDLAYSMLNMAVKDEVSFGAIYNAKTLSLPTGCARTAWLNLEKIFKPKSSAKKHELEQAFNQSSLVKTSKNPDEWFAELERIRLQLMLDFSVNIDDDRMISQIIYNITPTEYKTTVALIKRDLNKKVPLSLTDVMDDIRQIYGSIKQSGKHHPHGESALAAKSGKNFKKFKGDCRICGKKGHKAGDCWDNEKNKDKRPSHYKKPSERATPAKSSNLHCSYCSKDGHTEDRCFKKQRDEKDKKQATPEVAEVVLMAVPKSESHITPNTFIADSGATTHMRNSKSGMFNLKKWEVDVTVGNNETIKSVAKGQFKGTVTQADGSKINITLSDVLYVPDLCMNLLSLTKAIQNPKTTLKSEGKLISLLVNGQSTILFDQIFKSGSGQLLGVNIAPCAEAAHIHTTSVTMDQLHAQLGHPNEQVVKNTAQCLGMNIKGSQTPCLHCAIGKAKQKNVPKVSFNLATAKGERLCIDISYVNNTSLGGNQYWLLIQDEFTNYTWCIFLKSRESQASKLIPWLNTFEKDNNLQISYIRCDNSEENKTLRKAIKEDPQLSIQFEFVAPYTPQQNGKVERKFATLYGKVRAMLNWAQVTPYLRNKLWAQCANTATQLNNILCVKGGSKTPAQLFYGNNPSWVKNLHTFGEIGIVHDDRHAKIRGKLKDRGIPCMFLGYTEDHTSNVFQFFNLTTNQIINSRNVTWLNKSYGEFKNEKQPILPVAEFEKEENPIAENEEDPAVEDEENDNPENPEEPEDDSEDEDEDENGNENGNDFVLEPVPRSAPREMSRELKNLRTSYNLFPKGTPREVRNLTTSYNSDPLKHAETAMLTRILQKAYVENAYVSTIHDGSPEPKTYKEARKSKFWAFWWEAMCTEFRNMEEKNVWKIILKKDLPPGRKLIGNRWVYAQKDDGRYRARTVAKGFSQIPGKDFQENHAPVVNDTTFHLMLVLKLLLKLYAGQFDIETAFLYGDLDEELWMELPEGYCEFIKEVYGDIISADTHCLLLLKALYGLVQAARQWWKKFKEVMNSIGYLPSPADPCLFLKQSKDKKKSSFVIIYVDDGGIFGSKEDVDELIKALGKDFKVKNLGKLEHFVGCHVIENKAQDTMWIHQPKLLKHLKQEFSQYIHTTKVYVTPAGPKTMCMRPQEGDMLISPEEQTKFRSGVGMLLYLVKHSRPDISNAVRELSKVADGATPGHWKAMIRLIKYVMDTEHYGLKLKPKKQDELFYLEGISDSEYAGDKDNRISVYGYILYFCGAPIAWKSKAGKSVTLSSTEAEYFAASEVAKEVIYTKQLVESMGLKIKLPIVIRVDNVGAIYIANNHTISQRTKHIDIRAHFVREFIEDGILKIVFIRSEDNDADIFTKNTTEDLFIKHSSKNVENVEKDVYK